MHSLYILHFNSTVLYKIFVNIMFINHYPR